MSAKKTKESLAVQSAKLKGEMDSFLQKNSFQHNDLTLSLTYNPYHAQNGAQPFGYTLKSKTSYMGFSLQELAALKNFLNSISIIE